MGIIIRKIKDGVLYISDKSYNMAYECGDNIETKQDKVWEALERKRIPVKVQWEITEQCNYQCYYCYAKSLRATHDLSLEEVKRIIDQLKEIGIVFVELTGGEPLIRPDILEILSYLNEKEFILSILTNGSLLTEHVAQKLTEGKVKMVTLSLLAPTSEHCDRLTGVEGSFDSVIRTVEILRKYHIRYTLVSTITKQNVSLWEEYKRLERKLGTRIMFSIDVMPAFSGYEEVGSFALTGEDIKFLECFLPEDAKLNSQCDAGTAKFAITNQGELLPCLKYRNAVGNILIQKFETIWGSKRLRDILTQNLRRPEKCESCGKKDYCQAYCPAIYSLYERAEDRCNSAGIIQKAVIGGGRSVDHQ